VGPLACRAASHLAVDVFFSSAAAVEPTLGALEATLEDAELKRNIAQGAHQVVLAVDATKLGQRALAVGIEWEEVDLLVTELEPGDDRLEPYRGLTEVV